MILFVQVPHLAKVFADMSSLEQPWMRITHGTLFAISIDMCVLIFALRGREWWTLIFMAMSFVITLQFYKEWLLFSSDPLMAYSTLGIALIGVLAVYFLSKEVNKIAQEDDEDSITSIDDLDGIHFTPEEVEVIQLAKSGLSYQKIIDQFKGQGKTISRDRILKIRNKFKGMINSEEI